LFDRPTVVEGENGLDEWLLMFGGAFGLTEEQRGGIRRLLRPKMYRDGNWILDYRRLRIAAVRLAYESV